MRAQQASLPTNRQQIASTLVWCVGASLLLVKLVVVAWYIWYLYSPSSYRSLRLLAPSLPAALLEQNPDESIKVLASKPELRAFAAASATESFRGVLIDDMLGTIEFALCGSNGSQYVVSAVVNDTGALVVHEVVQVARRLNGAACEESASN